MSDPKFIDAQWRALMFLPGDGTWIYRLGFHSPAVHSLKLYSPKLVESYILPNPGKIRRKWRLSPAGIEARNRLEEGECKS